MSEGCNFQRVKQIRGTKVKKRYFCYVASLILIKYYMGNMCPCIPMILRWAYVICDLSQISIKWTKVYSRSTPKTQWCIKKGILSGFSTPLPPTFIFSNELQ